MNETVLDLMAQVVSSYVSHNPLPGEALPGFMRTVYQSLAAAGTSTAGQAAEPATPKVDAKKSVFADRLVCLACGKPFRTLKRHLGTEHQLTPQEYRQRYGLLSSYPVVAPDYAKVRSAMAKKIGLGRGGHPRPAKRGRPKRR